MDFGRQKKMEFDLTLSPETFSKKHFETNKIFHILRYIKYVTYNM